jgi:hypothetical protein
MRPASFASTACTLAAAAALITTWAACGGGTSATGTGASESSSTGKPSSGSGTPSTSSGSGAGGGSTSATKACADEAAAVCALRDTCLPNFEIERNYGTIALCQSRTAQSCVNSLDAKGQANTPANVEKCATAYPTEACADFFDSNTIAACVPPAGSLATGSACGASGQCASTWCAVTSTTVCGTCQPLPAAGAACSVQADCGRDLACAIPTVAGDGGAIPTTGVCAAWVDANGMCLTGFNPCKEGLSCVGDDPATMTMGTCQTAGSTVGAACQTTRKTVPGCADGYACIAPANSMGMGTCQAITLVAAGATCGDLGGTPVTSVAQCKDGGLCAKTAPNDLTGKCVAAAADGAACDNDPSIGPPCLSPAKCVVPAGSSGTSGTCTFPNATTCM